MHSFVNDEALRKLGFKRCPTRRPGKPGTYFYRKKWFRTVYTFATDYESRAWIAPGKVSVPGLTPVDAKIKGDKIHFSFRH